MKNDIQNLGKFKINKIYCGNALRLIKDIPDKSVDLIVTDPPFGIEFKAKKANYNRKSENVLEGYKEISRDKYPDFSVSWIKESARILKANGSIYIVSGWNNLKDILIALDQTDLNVLNHIIWKYQFGVYTTKKFVTSHYHILYAVKNKKKYKFNKIEHYPEDVWIINREYWNGKIKTPTRLPEALVEKIILYSSNEKDIVFDPFMGSGTVAFCAKKLNRNYFGFEAVKEYVKFAKKRINNKIDFKKPIQQTQMFFIKTPQQLFNFK